MPRIRHPLLIATLVALGLMLLFLAISPQWAAQRVAAELRQRIEAADEQHAAALVERLAALDAAGLPHLIELLDDARGQVRHAARETISQRLEMWSVQRTAASERQVAQLAGLLAKHQAPADPHSRVFLKLTAIKLLRWPPLADNAKQIQLVADCGAVLERTVAEQTTEPTPRRPAGTQFEPAPHELTEVNAKLPYDLHVQSSDERTAEDAEPELLPSEEDQPPAPLLEQHRPRPIGTSETSLEAEPLDEVALRALSTRSLIRHLQDVPETVVAAEQELRRRGFNDQSLKLARALDHPDPHVREQLAELLPGASGIDPAPWLWELAEDTDENVRRAARGILSTSSNPKTRARLSRLR